MKTYDISKLLSENTYPGRGIVIGKTSDSRFAVSAYFIMGRSENSRNRIFSVDGDGIKTEAFDPSKLSDPSLIIYSPVRVIGENIIVTNGDQTDTVYDGIKAGKSFEEALRSREFEPDAPNFTPRISGMITLSQGDFSYKMSILKSADENGSACIRNLFEYEKPLAGIGHFIHTYKCDGNPIPTFEGEPEQVEIPDSINDFTDALWKNLNNDNKVSLFVRYIELSSGKCETKIINKNI